MKPLRLCLLAASLLAAPGRGADVPPGTMMYADTEKLGRPFSKDPSVIKFGGRYLMYFSLPAPAGKNGWTVGIAESHDLTHWQKIGELLPAQDVDKTGLCAPGALVIGGVVHLFYQSYGGGPKDAVCHAWSKDGVHFERDPSNPVFRPSGAWTCGRAIDAEAFPFNGKLYLYYATRDPKFKIQTVGVASADLRSDFDRAAWTNLSTDGPALRPEQPWEKDCIEAPTVCRRGDALYMFYAGGYNNQPQQIGCAVSKDAVHWTRLGDGPFLPNGAPGTWNSSESGHPGVFVDGDGQTYLFYQGNNDHGHTWLLSCVRLGWKDDKPYVVTGAEPVRDADAVPK